MTLWIVLTSMVALAVCGLSIPLMRRHVGGRGDTTLAVLKAQLADVEGQRTAGVVSADAAHGLITEIKRRILSEGRENARPVRPFDARRSRYLAICLAVFVAAVSALLYANTGRPDLATRLPENVAANGDAPGVPSRTKILAGVIEKLKARLAHSPNAPQGWSLLGWIYLQTGNPSEAVNAYGRAIVLDPSNAADRSAQGDALVQAAGGQVTPAALAAFHGAIRLDSGDPRARYFLAYYKEQQGDHAGAMADWIALLKSAPPDAPWLPQVRKFVERIARQDGDDIASKLPPPPPAQNLAPVGMSPAAQQILIRGMVDRLATELRANPRNEKGWQRLMRARMVLGEASSAAVAYRDARRAFADSPAGLAKLRDSARAFGVPGA